MNLMLVVIETDGLLFALAQRDAIYYILVWGGGTVG